MSASFAVNGRYLTQNLSGVQRYARNIVNALDRLPAAEGSAVISPRGTHHPVYERMQALETGVLTGYAWEQSELPIATRGQRLLNLCNMAPVIKSEQIVCIHDTNVLSSPDSYTRVFRAVYTSLQPLFARRAIKVATVSHASARQLARYLPLSLSEIVVLPNGHEHALSWDPSKAQLAADLPVHTEDRPFVLAIGAAARHKNISLLIDLAPRLDELGINLVVIGAEGFIRQARGVMPSNVHALGHVSDDDLAYLLDHALCLAFPSLTEGFGLPLVEAMARGCPVVSSDCASMPEVCGDAALFASPFDASQWLDRIRGLAASPNLRSELIGRGREQCRKFSWLESARGYLDLLETPLRAGRSLASIRKTTSLAEQAPAREPAPHITAVFATLGRPEVVSRTVRHFLATQTLRPTSVIVSCAEPEDAGELLSNGEVSIVTGPVGLAAQRNTALDRLDPEAEIVAFFDDDFVAHPQWLAEAAQLFRDESQIAAITGRVLADGIKGPGIPFDDAVSIVMAASGLDDLHISEPVSPYGCNMAFRMTSVGNTRFDERLVLYGWLEDRDFGGQLARRGGRLVRLSSCLGAHMGVKSGRTSGERLGYSQVANPVHLIKKGTMAPRTGLAQMLRNMTINAARAPFPEPFVDRRGRLRGNLLALLDCLKGDLRPERAALIGKNRSKRGVEAKPAEAGRI